MSALVPAAELPTAVATIVVSAGVGVVYSYVGYRISQRPVSAESRLASAQFALWWIGLGASVAITATDVSLATLNLYPFPLAVTIGLVSIIVDCAFLWGLTGFLIYVYTGRYHLVELSVFYAAFYVTALYWILSQDPSSVAYQAGGPAVQYSATPALALTLVVLVGLVAPEIVGAVLYLSLLRRTTDRSTRFRIILVGGGILLWFAIDAFLPSSTSAWVLAKGLLDLVPGIMSLVAFFPPVWVRTRFGVTAPEIEGTDRVEAPGPT